jgi:glycosyltransferase involved in cell wall biosynthesis
MPYVLTTHSSFYKRNLIKDFRKPLIKEVIEASDKALAVSASLAKDVSERLGTDFDMEVMPNIIDDTFEEAVLSSKANNVFTFVSIGRLDKNKNQQLLIRAFAAAVKKGMPALLHLGGAGPELENLKKLAVKEGVEKKVMFLGHLSQKEVMEELLNSNVLCLTSRYETFGVIIIEALACGMPVIATDCGGPSELINDKNGLVVKCDDVNGLAEAMLTMFSNYEEYSPEHIRLDCLSRYSGKKISQRLLHIYEAVVNRPVLEEV